MGEGRQPSGVRVRGSLVALRGHARPPPFARLPSCSGAQGPLPPGPSTLRDVAAEERGDRVACGGCGRHATSAYGFSLIYSCDKCPVGPVGVLTRRFRAVIALLYGCGGLGFGEKQAV